MHLSRLPGQPGLPLGLRRRNNVYLFGHAYSVFKPLHDAYVRGRLHKGMEVYLRRRRAAWSTLRRPLVEGHHPDNGAWAYAAQSRPSLTLQTCVGASSQYRLIVRLVRAD